MNPHSKTKHLQNLYAAAWRQTGPGILIALMFVMIASAIMSNEQSRANGSNTKQHGTPPLNQQLSDLLFANTAPATHTIRLELPIQQLRDADGEITSNCTSLFTLLARRAKSLSLTVTLTTDSYNDAKFAVAIAARMMNEVSLEATQIRIGVDEQAINAQSTKTSVLTVNVAMREVIGKDVQ